MSKRLSTALKPSIHAFVRSIFHLSLYISSSNSHSSFGSPPVLGLGHIFGTMRASELLPVKACVKVAEKTVHRDSCIEQLPDNILDVFLYPMEVSVIPGLWLGHGKRYALIVREEEGVGRASFLPPLIFSLFSASIDRCVGTVNMGYG